jgi:PPOX class probable F420-dependent enzyme
MDYTVSPTASLDTLPFTALGGQPGFAPGAIERFVREPRIAVLAYARADGRPGQVPIWYLLRDGAFEFSTVTGSPKHRALLRDPRVCLTIQDERPPYRAVLADGAVTLAPLPPESAAAGELAVRYFGRVGAAEYARLTAEEYARTGLTRVALRPTALRGFDNTQAIGRAALAFVRLRNRLPIPRSWL